MYKILIVEDDETIRNGIKTLLELQGYYVDIAVNGVDGLKKFDETYSLVIMDIIMPLLSGIDACKKLREESSVPILFLTAKSSEIDIMQGFEVGGDDYLVKPFSNMELISRVKALLRAVSGPDRPVHQRLFPGFPRGGAHPLHGEQLCEERHHQSPRQKEVYPGAACFSHVYCGFQDRALDGKHRRAVPDAARALHRRGSL